MMRAGTLASGAAMAPNFGLWNTPIEDPTNLDVDSAAIAAKFAYMVDRQSRSLPTNWGPTLGEECPFFLMPSGHPLTPVPVDSSPGNQQAMAGFRRGVPLPADFRVSQDHDENATIWSPSMDAMWDWAGGQKAIFPTKWNGPGWTGEPGGSLPAGTIQYKVAVRSTRPDGTTGETRATSVISPVSAGGGSTNTRITLWWHSRFLALAYVIYRNVAGAGWKLFASGDPSDGAQYDPALGVASTNDPNVWVPRWVDDGTRAAGPPGDSVSVDTATTSEWRNNGGSFLQPLSTDPHFKRVVTPNGTIQPTGGTASCIPPQAGLITMRDWQAGRADHALRYHGTNVRETLQGQIVKATAGEWHLAYPSLPLNGNVQLPQGTISVTHARTEWSSINSIFPQFPSSGILNIEGETVTYTGKGPIVGDTATFTGCSGGTGLHLSGKLADGGRTADFPFNVAASVVQSELRALMAGRPGFTDLVTDGVAANIEVTGGPGDRLGTSPYRIWFPRRLGGAWGQMNAFEWLGGSWANGIHTLTGGTGDSNYPAGISLFGGVEEEYFHAFPAQGHDNEATGVFPNAGKDPVHGVPTGARLFFDHNLPEPEWTGSDNEKKLAKLVFDAVQKYGIIWTDGTRGMSIGTRGEGFAAIWPSGGASTHSALMQAFSPTNCASMRVEKMKRCTGSPCLP